MSGNQLGYIKGRMGLKGKIKPGEMISRMNEMKLSNLSKEVLGKVVKAPIKKII